MSGTLHPIYGELPWHADGEEPRGIYTRGGDTVAFVELPVASLEDWERAAKVATLIAAAPTLLSSLQSMLERYTSLVNCGDCGNWDPEQEPNVIAARAAISKATK
jgi:hypothetical protein